MKFILASQSPYRKIQLESAGLQFQAEAPRVNEEELKIRGPKEPKALAEFLARAKATSLKLAFPDSFILGGDQLVDLQGTIIGKPGSRERAIVQLNRMQGQTHRLITALFMRTPTRELIHTDITEITLRKMARIDIETYVDRDQPYDCAGSYKIEKAGMCLIEKIKTEDPSAIQGIPLKGLAQMILDCGIPLAKLWQR